MSYSTGNPIDAADYNTFATATAGMNSVFGDIYPGATSLPNAGFGYGQSPALLNVVTGNPILASEWTSLFQSIKRCGGHQGTSVSPPVPATNPIIGDTIVAHNTPGLLQSSIASVISNKFNIAVGQSTLTLGASYTQPPAAKPWTNTLTWNSQVNFGSWNNARYFFNSGGSLNLSGSYTPGVTPDDLIWASLLSNMSPVVFKHSSTTSGSTSSSVGFYQLSSGFSKIYQAYYGNSMYYSPNFVKIEAKLNSAPGTDGIVVFKVTMSDTGSLPRDVKTGTTTLRIDDVKASGSFIVYPGSVIVSTIGANSGYIAA